MIYVIFNALLSDGIIHLLACWLNEVSGYMYMKVTLSVSFASVIALGYQCKMLLIFMRACGCVCMRVSMCF